MKGAKTMSTTETIAEQNDRFRREGPSKTLPGLVVMTCGIAALPLLLQVILHTKVRYYSRFTEDNDPHGEHDFGAFTADSVGRVFWKIDYYADANMEYGAESPLNSYRVLTIMLASEY
jgi:hypothetical protein